ncbi:MAG TPA: RNA methyltransferase, partial [Solirubrobacteraceae bacterium]|nr:RNA methyltransferase [Solirubrobacteraceae bacterium]
MIVYGRHPVREVLRGRRRHAVTEVLATESAAREPWLTGVPIRISSPQLLDRTCATAEHQGICVEAGPYLYAGSEELLARADPLILALDELQDPHNLGAIARTAECAGADGLVICERRAAAVTPAVCKASAGAVEHLRIARVANLVAFIDRAKEAG